VREQREVRATLGAVIGERVRIRRERRTKRGAPWRQADLAQEMRASGLPWTQATVAAVEAGQRSLALEELAGLCGVFYRDLTALLSLDEGEEGLHFAGELWQPSQVVVELGRGRHMRWAGILESLREGAPLHIALLGGPSSLDWSNEPSDPMYVKAARALGVTVAEVEKASRKLYGRALPEERDRRLGEVEDLAPRTLQARRGHITRELLSELRGKFESTASGGKSPKPGTAHPRRVGGARRGRPSQGGQR
jgi:hypothetical protein